MLHLILGRSGAGKTEYVRTVLGECVKEGTGPVFLIVPEQYSFDSERSVLEQFGGAEAQKIEVLSFSRLADRVFRETGGMAGTPADDGTKIILMLRALSQVQDELQYYAHHIANISLARSLLKAVRELRQAKISPEMLESAAKQSSTDSFRMKFHEVSIIYAAYEALLEDGYIDENLLSERLCQRLDSSAFFEGASIAIDGFKGFTRQELSVLERLMKQSGQLWLTLCTEDLYRSDASMLFDAVNETGRGITELAKRNGVRVVIDRPEKTGIREGQRYKTEELRYFERHFLDPAEPPYEKKPDKDSGKNPGKNPEQPITVYTAQTKPEECRFIAAYAKKLMREEGFRCRDIAVIVRQESEWQSELQAAFRRYEIPLFEDARQPIENQPLIAMVRALLELLTGGFTTDNILSYLKTGLSPLSQEDIDRLENYALLWDLRSSDWQAGFTQNPDGLGFAQTPQSKLTLGELNVMRETVMSPLNRLRDACKDTDAGEISRAVWQFMTETDVKHALKELALSYEKQGLTALAEEQDRVWDLTVSVFDRLSTVCASLPTDLKTYRGLFSAVVSCTDLGRIPQGLDEITVGSADRIRLSTPRVVFAAGCAEGVFPALLSDAGIFLRPDRKELRKCGIPLDFPETLQNSEERFIAYMAVTAPSERLVLSYHCQEGPGENLLPSPIVENARSLFGSNCRELSRGKLPPDWFAESASSALAAYAGLLNAQTPDGAAAGQSLRAALQTDRLVSGRLDAIDGAASPKPFQLRDHDTALQLFGKEMRLSASRVDVYYKCPFEYFCKYGLGAKPRSTAKLDPAQSGTVIHYVLEQIIRENGKEGLLAMDEEARAAAIKKWLAVFLEERMGGMESKPVRFRYLYRRLAVILGDIVRRLCQEFRESDFAPADFELEIGNPETGIPSYTLDLPDGGKLSVIGFVDRVDTFEKDHQTYIRIVDYKSGGKDFRLSDVLSGLNMQMLIYLFAIEANGGKRYENPVSAGILYYPAKRNTVSMDTKDEAPEQVAKDKAKADRGNGLFLNNAVVLNAMEHGLEGRFLPVTQKKNGGLSGNLIDLKNMGQLRKKIDTILEDMAVSLHDGAIPACPANGKNYDNTCQYCDYFPVCGFEDGAVRDIPDMTNDKAIQELTEKTEKEEDDNG